MNQMSFVTLTSDFGLQDSYVGTMKGVILSIAPHVRLVDLSHEIPHQDITHASYVLGEATPYYPQGTIHLAVIDPGVGSDRTPIIIKTNGYYYVGPDNGIFSHCLGDEYEVYSIENVPQITKEKSTTFHGRDIFAPAAAALAQGIPLDKIGEKQESLIRFDLTKPQFTEKSIEGKILHVDHFGNAILNIHKKDLDGIPTEKLELSLKNRIIRGLRHTYSEQRQGEPLVLFGHHGYLEIAVNEGNASKAFELNRDDRILFTLKEAS